MSKTEFLKELESRLNGLPSKDIDERIEFYSEMIDDRVEEGKTEEEAIAEIGTVDDVVQQIAKETPLLKLVKEKVKPKTRLKAWEIVLICLGFPLWFPLLLTAMILVFVAYILLWILVIVTYAVELALSLASIASLVLFFVYLPSGGFSFFLLGCALVGAGAAILMFFGCKWATIGTIKMTKAISLSIKKRFVSRG